MLQLFNTWQAIFLGWPPDRLPSLLGWPFSQRRQLSHPGSARWRHPLPPWSPGNQATTRERPRLQWTVKKSLFSVGALWNSKQYFGNLHHCVIEFNFIFIIFHFVWFSRSNWNFLHRKKLLQNTKCGDGSRIFRRGAANYNSANVLLKTARK